MNFETRTGIKEEAVDDFLRKVDAVNDAIIKMKNGELNPNDVHIDGIKSPEEIAAEAKMRDEKKERFQQKEREARLKRQKEEHDRWWRGAELLYGPVKDNQPIDSAIENSGVQSKTEETQYAEELLKQQLAERYSLEYSRWDKWTPDDPASKEEIALKQADEDDVQNKIFEKNNPQFCKEFVEDAKKREASKQEKAASANILRLKGNRYFKAKVLDRALELYMESLRKEPYNTSTLCNLAQVYIRLEQWTDGLEFCNRTLHVDACNIKALSRRALINASMNNEAAALCDLNKALSIDRDCIDVIKQRNQLIADIEDNEEEKRILSAVGSSNSLEDTLLQKTCKEVDQLCSAVLSNSHSKNELALLSAILKDSVYARVYFRKSGYIDKFITLCKDSMSQDHAVFDILRKSTQNQKRSQILLLHHGFIEHLVLLLNTKKTPKITHKIGLIALEIIYESFGCEDIAVKCMKSTSFFSGVLGLFEGSSTPLQGLVRGAEVLRNSLVGPHKSLAVNTIGSLEVDVVLVVSNCLAKYAPTISDSNSHQELVEVLCGALANIAMYEQFAPRFGVISVSILALVDILNIKSSNQDGIKCLALAALMNICSGKESSAEQNQAQIHEKNAIKIVLEIVLDFQSNDPCLLTIRCFGLLARLSSHLPACIELSENKNLRIILKRLRKNASFGGHVQVNSTFVMDERDQLVRVLANISRKCPREMGAALGGNEEVEALVSFLPPARREGGVNGVVTRDTVALRPLWSAPPTLIGNVCGILLHLLDNELKLSSTMKILIDDGSDSSGGSVCGIAKLISAFANSSDGPVRKNAAICLAKLAKNPCAREKIDHLRGMEMLMHAGRNLL